MQNAAPAPKQTQTNWDSYVSGATPEHLSKNPHLAGVIKSNLINRDNKTGQYEFLKSTEGGQKDQHPTDAYQDGKHYMGPAPHSNAPIRDWLDSVEIDLREGGDRTVVGRTLGKLQGNSGRYRGLNSGGNKGAANMMGSVPLGAVETARGVANTKDHPIKGPLQAVGGVAHMMELPGMFVGAAEAAAVEAAPAIRSGVKSVLESLPTATRGAKRLNEVKDAAGALPVEFNRTTDVLKRVRNLTETGADTPPILRKLIRRHQIAESQGKHITYSEARDWYSNLSHMSRDGDVMRKLTPALQKSVTLALDALKKDIGDTAAEVDKAALYFGGMNDYAGAMRAHRISSAIKTLLKNKAIQAGLGTGAGAVAAKAVMKEFR